MDAKATHGTEHGCKHLEELLKDLEDIECFVADPGYLPRRNCKLVAEKGGVPYTKPEGEQPNEGRGPLALEADDNPSSESTHAS